MSSEMGGSEMGASAKSWRPSIRRQASGGVNLQTIGPIAATGVDRVSVGALTHSAAALDIGLDDRAG